MSKKTLVLGAVAFPSRYAYLAVQRLTRAGHQVIPVGIRPGIIEGITILLGQPKVENVDTITLYVNPSNQVNHYDYILSLKPKRIVFNPGTENPELIKLAKDNNIETIMGCTLVMLASGTY